MRTMSPPESGGLARRAGVVPKPPLFDLGITPREIAKRSHFQFTHTFRHSVMVWFEVRVNKLPSWDRRAAGSRSGSREGW